MPGEGMTRQERVVMALWDGGVPSDQIAARLALKRRRVQQIVAYFGSADEHRVECAAIAKGSAALAAAINRARPA